MTLSFSSVSQFSSLCAALDQKSALSEQMVLGKLFSEREELEKANTVMNRSLIKYRYWMKLYSRKLKALKKKKQTLPTSCR